MLRRKNIRSLIIGIALICCVSLVLIGAAGDIDYDGRERIIEELDWNTHAVVLNTKGEILESFEMPINGPILEITWSFGSELEHSIGLGYSFHMPDEVKQTIDWEWKFPDNLEYYTYYNQSLLHATGSTLQYSDLLESLPECYIGLCWWIAERDSSYIDGHLLHAVSLEKEYAIAYWEDGGEGYLLVASTDPNTTVDEIKAYFSIFVDNCTIVFDEYELT